MVTSYSLAGQLILSLVTWMCHNWCCVVDGPQRHPLLATRALVVVPLDGQASWVNPGVETLPAFSWSLC